jgi:ABC-2 type transport system permease protein
MRRFRAVFKKEFRQIGRDPLSLGVLVLVPALLLVLYGYALSFDVKHVQVGVLDQDRTPDSRAFLDSLFGNPYFDRNRTLERIQEADGLLARGDVRAVLVVPPRFSEGLLRGDDVRVQVLVDASDSTVGSTVVGYLDALADRATRKARTEALARAGLGPALPVVVPEPRIWFNPDLVSARFLVPGLIGLLLMLSAVVATSLSIVREKERETMEQMMVSPLKPEELILGKLVPYVFICLVTMTMILVLGYVLFGVVVRGSFALLGLVTLLFLFAALGLGVLISSVTRSQQMAFQIAIITSLLPSVILSGLIFPIQNMPAPIRVVTFLVIPRYFVSALRKIILKGASLGDLWLELAGMVALGVLFNIVAARNTRKAI